MLNISSPHVIDFVLVFRSEKRIDWGEDKEQPKSANLIHIADEDYDRKHKNDNNDRIGADYDLVVGQWTVNADRRQNSPEVGHRTEEEKQSLRLSSRDVTLLAITGVIQHKRAKEQSDGQQKQNDLSADERPLDRSEHFVVVFWLSLHWQRKALSGAQWHWFRHKVTKVTAIRATAVSSLHSDGEYKG